MRGINVESHGRVEADQGVFQRCFRTITEAEAFMADNRPPPPGKTWMPVTCYCNEFRRRRRPH